MPAKEKISVVAKKDLLLGIDKALKFFKVGALVKRDKQAIYDFIKKSSDIKFDYHPTVLPPKKFFFPAHETLCEFDNKGNIDPVTNANPMVLFGIRPCDLNGIKIMHEAFSEGHGDPNYLAKAEQTVVIGLDCHKLCDKDAFCFKLKTNYAKGGFDIMLSDLGKDLFSVEIATAKGKLFAKRFWNMGSDDAKLLKKFQAKKKRNFSKEKPLKNLDKLPELFEKNRDHPVWEKEGSRCLSCGSCVMVCPTCYCFNVGYEWELNLKKGKRSRTWGACMVSSFATIASGENFRPHPTQRLQHRMHRKFNYLMKKHGMPVCVGCGRCVRACLANISPRTIVEAIDKTGK